MATVDIQSVENEELVKKVVFMATQVGHEKRQHIPDQRTVNYLEEQIRIGEAEILKRLNQFP